jgi:hypothetical protein
MCTFIASYQDPLRKREDFAVSLRKKKTTEIINAKRRRMFGSKCHNPYSDELGTKSNPLTYDGGTHFEKSGEFETLIGQVC